MFVGKDAGPRKVIAAAALFVLFVFSSVCLADQQELEQIRRAIQARGAQWTAGETSVSQLPPEERKSRLGLIKPTGASAEQAEVSFAVSAPVTASAPSGTFDWRDYNGVNYVTEVKDQRSCGSCWAFAVTAALESQVILGGGAGKDLAEQILVSCSGAGTCDGGGVSGASNYIKMTGLPLESCFPYTSADTPCENACQHWQDSTDGVIDWHWVATTAPTIDNIKDALYTYGPLVTTFDVYTDFDYYRNGIYRYSYGSYRGSHAVTIVGYDDDNQCFIVKNSWGKGWGEDGFFRIDYNQLSGPVWFGNWTIAYEGYRHLPTPPAAPTGLSATTFSSDQINLYWIDNATNESGYYVERCQGSDCTSFDRIATLGAGSTAFNDTGLAGNTTYRYRVQAYNVAGNSAYSDPAAATTRAVPPAVSIGLPSTTLTGSSPVTYTVTYSGADTIILSPSKITLNQTGTANGSVAVTGSGNTSRTVTISGIIGNGTLGISIAAGTAIDQFGNTALASGASTTFTVDNSPPTFSIGNPSAATTKSGPISYTVTYAGADTITLSASSVTLNKTGTADGNISVTGSGNTSRTVTISGITGNGTLGIGIAAGTATDQAGNTTPAAGPSAVFMVDSTPPTVLIGPPSAASTRSCPVTYTVTYSGANTISLAADNIVLDKTGTADGEIIVSGTGSTRTVTISKITGDGTLGISIVAWTATDQVGNGAPSAGPSAAFTVDHTLPAQCEDLTPNLLLLLD